MDALPVEEKTGLPFASKVRTTYLGNEVGVMHACGHDAHVAILMGVAEFLAKNKEELKGNVMLIFQPAEEGPLQRVEKLTLHYLSIPLYFLLEIQQHPLILLHGHHDRTHALLQPHCLNMLFLPLMQMVNQFFLRLVKHPYLLLMQW